MTVTEGKDSAIAVPLRIVEHVPAEISLLIKPGTAKEGKDYLPHPEGVRTPGGVSLHDVLGLANAGDVWKANIVTVVVDDVPEGPETFTIEIVKASSLTVKSRTITITILDDDGPAPKAVLPEVWVSDDSRPEGDPGDRAMLTFAVHLSKASASEVAVDYRTVGLKIERGAARSGVDFEPASGTLRLPPGKTIGFVHVKVVPDLEPEQDEDFYLELVGAQGATIFRRGTGTALGRILDDDGVPTASLVDPGPRLKEGNAGGTRFVFTVRLSHAFRRALTVGYRTFEGARAHDQAIAGVDFAALRGVLTFRPGETEKKIVVTVFGDRKPEHNESFAVLLEHGGASTANVPLYELQNATILIDDGAPDDTAVHP